MVFVWRQLGPSPARKLTERACALCKVLVGISAMIAENASLGEPVNRSSPVQSSNRTHPRDQ